MSKQAVLDFWFLDIEPSQWWEKSPEFDLLIKNQFGSIHEAAVLGELFEWRKTLKGRLAEIIVLDQFSRNIFRDDPRAFLFDSMALVLSQESIKLDYKQSLDIKEIAFLFMPFMHSESRNIHKQAVELFSLKGLESELRFELAHKKIIDRFGRYPHRNFILGRQSTQDEIDFLNGPNSSF